MAGNIQADSNGDILVDFDYNNIIVVDPNKTIDNQGRIKERLVDHESLVMFVNLEADVLPRTKLAVGGSPRDRITTISVSKMNFLKPTKDTFLGTGYYDELTGKNATNFQGVNQPREQILKDSKNELYKKNTVVDEQNVMDNGLLGITSIEITTNSSFVPSVRIQLEDVQGKALFQLGDSSPYAAFFNLPYPQFYLTIKGYYGQAIRYQLNLEKFNCSYNSFSGNYQISLDFKGYKFNILNEVLMAHLLATPHMYGQTFTITNSPDQLQTTSSSPELNAKTENAIAGAASNSPNNLVTQITSERGYQKIREVYSEYKAKGLVPEDLPELTLVQLMNKLETFENNIINSYPKANLEPLTNIRTYKSLLGQFYDAVRGSNVSWFSKYLNPNALVLTDGSLVYIFKSNLDQGAINNANAELKTIIQNYNTQLNDNPTLGTKGASPIPNTISYDNMLATEVQANVDWNKTVTFQTGILEPTSGDVQTIITTYQGLYNVVFETAPNGDLILIKKSAFVFEGKGRFNREITSMEAQANKKLSDYEAKISADLANRLQDSSLGLGFSPTVRNIIAVIMASAEAFIRLMDDVHSNAWDQKYNPIRKQAILSNPSSAPGSDTRDNLPLTPGAQAQNQGLDTSQIPVYPWPQFFVETNEDKKGRFQLKYIADPSLVDSTQGFLYNVWPEVEFVEEYLRGITQKFNPPLAPPPLDNQNQTTQININAIEFPNFGLSYLNKEELKFFYEIWERQFLTAHYSNLVRAVGGQIDELIRINYETEANNIFRQVNGNAPFLALKLKNFNLNSANYEEFLRTSSNFGTGRAYQDFIRDFFVTPYIKNITENSFSIVSTDNLGKLPDFEPKSNALEILAKSDNNKPEIIDTLPFTSSEWVSTNMVGSRQNQGDLVYQTKNTLQVFKPRTVLANFGDIYNFTENRPVSNFNYLTAAFSEPLSNTDLNAYYLSRLVNPTKLYPSEGYYTYDTPSGEVRVSTTSMMNTPFFINALQKGIYNQRRNDLYPYVQAAYLFLNSLPLSSLREKYKSFNNESKATLDKDYIASVFKKYGAIHKIPYAWILKMGSIWHRYKKYLESGVDILDGVWEDFDYTTNYSPVLSSVTQTYSFDYSQQPVTITLQTENEKNVKFDVGFYPKLITDLNYFYNGFDFFSGYTNQEIQDAVNSGMKILSNTDSQLFGINSNGKQVQESTRSILLPKANFFSGYEKCNPLDNTSSDDYYVVPSFGTKFNQLVYDCVSNPFAPTNSTTTTLTDNPNLYNGTVRMLWGAPNFGYFDANQQKKPRFDEYINTFTAQDQQTNFKFRNRDDYSKIEEIFSVFDKKILDQFELKFLDFCKPLINSSSSDRIITLNESNVDVNATYRNFQALFKSLMTVPSQTKNTGATAGNLETDYFNATVNTQLTNFNNTIKGFLQYDEIIRYGNPSGYNRRVFDSYRSYLSTTQYVTSPITFKPYVPGTLPSESNPISLSTLVANNPKDWTTLQLEVGFSTISGVTYTDNGSFITDFFIDSNIEFTSQNIVILAPLIKMYATQKYNNNSLTAQEFKNQITAYLNRAEALQNYFLDQTLIKVKADLPNQQPVAERTIQSVVDGQQTKLELYEVFKALNDKWVAGGDFKDKTLFEDILFLDRASRNIGETILIDIFDLKNFLNETSLNERMSVFTFIASILQRNNFTVMNLPAYVNFYNVQEVSKNAQPQPEGSLEFANRLWGTFLDVDYRNSAPKMICFYVGKPSEYLEMTNTDFRYRSDGFDMKKASELPLLEDQKNKTDWGVSNKCVGFNVEIGTRNQNIFYGFSVNQDPGKATSESFNILVNMVDQATGRNTATQNVSLFNLYKTRSYACTVQSLGNALIQPTMYFQLQHVPMFNGPYFITEVSHSIQPGSFNTNFTGVRQAIFDLPSIDNFLQQVNQNLLTKLQEVLQTRKDEPSAISTTDNTKSQNLPQNSENKSAPQNSCVAKLNPYYAQKTGTDAYLSKESVVSGITPAEMATIIKNKAAQVQLRVIIYCICYLRTFRKEGNSGVGKFYGYDNNFAVVSLEDQLNPSDSYFSKTYSCVQVKGNQVIPAANFESIDKFIDFMVSRLLPVVPQIFLIGLQKYYVCYWPVSNVSEQYFTENPKEFEEVKTNLYKAVNSAVEVGICTKDEATYFGLTIQENSTPPTPSPTPGQFIDPNTCPPPKINSFNPLTGKTDTIIQVNGSNLLTTTGITVNTVEVQMSTVEIFNDQTIRFTIPPFPQQIPVGKIVVRTKFGNATSDRDFTHV